MSFTGTYTRNSHGFMFNQAEPNIWKKVPEKGIHSVIRTSTNLTAPTISEIPIPYEGAFVSIVNISDGSVAMWHYTSSAWNMLILK